MSERRILIVDDEPQMQRFLKPALTASGFSVASAMSGAEALRAIRAECPDLVVLDLGLPDMDGKNVIVQTRVHSKVPIIVLSARDHEPEKIAALDLGANDYVAKPFGIGELLARIRVVLRPRAPEHANIDAIEIGPLKIDFAGHRASKDGEAIPLTPKEFEVLGELARNAGRVVTHRHLLTKVWGPAHAADTQYLRVFIGQIRAKIESNPTEPRLVLTEPGIGYRMNDEG